MRARLVLGCALFAAALFTPLAPPVPVAAGSESFVSGATTYVLAPADKAVHVTVDMTFRNTKPDSSTIRYYFNGYRIGLQKEARRVRVAHGGAALAHKLTDRTDYQELDVTFNARVFHNQTYAFRVQYDLLDSGPRSEGSIRVGDAIAAFYAWSYGADQASVKIVLPAGFTPRTQGDPLKTATSGSTTVLSATGIQDRERWFAWVSGERPSALSSSQISVEVGGQPETIEVRAFPDDALWGQTVRDRLTRGLPMLGDLIGLPWPITGALQVTEAYTPLLGGYAGFYRQGESTGLAEIRITEDPDPLVIVHEASHAWFNADLFVERWINEGLANEYASRVLGALGDSIRRPEPVSRQDAASFALNGWPDPTKVDTKKADVIERYGYNASWTVMDRLVAEVGEARMRAVFAAAKAGAIPYVGRPAPEKAVLGTRATDWRGLLDLLEQAGGSRSAEDAFATWVVTEAERSTLDRHTTAVKAYERLMADGHGWLPGYVVRRPMAAWDFAAATTTIADAEAVLAVRDRIAALARELAITPAGDLQTGYEGATSSLDATRALADDELRTFQAIRDARAAVAADHDLFVTIGLLGSTPQMELDAAAADASAGRLQGARGHAATAVATIDAAATAGQQRAVAAGAVGALLLGGGTVLIVRRRRARQRRAVAATIASNAALAATAATMTGDEPTESPAWWMDPPAGATAGPPPVTWAPPPPPPSAPPASWTPTPPENRAPAWGPPGPPNANEAAGTLGPDPGANVNDEAAATEEREPPPS